MQMQPMMAAYYPSNVTTDHIQQVPLLTSHRFFPPDSASPFPQFPVLQLLFFYFVFGVSCVLLKSTAVIDYIFILWLHFHYLFG